MKNNFDLSTFIVYLFRKRIFIISNGLLAVIGAVAYVFFIAEPQFKSSVSFLPPHKESPLLSILPISPMGDLGGADIMPQQIQTIFESKTLLRKIIDKFNYYEKYKLTDNENKFENALKVLKKDLTFEIEEIGNLGVTQHVAYTISSYHTSRDTALLIVNETFRLLDSTIRHISTDRAKRNRQFIETQLDKNNGILRKVQNDFTEFQITNKIFNIPSQVKLALKSYGNLKAQIIANEIKIERLRKNYRDDYPTIQSAKNDIRVLEERLKEMELNSDPDVLMGLNESAKMMPKYTEFMKNIRIQEELALLLTQQLETAKIKEAKDVSPLKIIDNPFKAEYKARPKRALLLIAIFVGYMFLVIGTLFVIFFYQAVVKQTHLYGEILGTFRKN